MSIDNFRIKATRRGKLGSGESNRLRKSGCITGVIYKKSAGNDHISFNKKIFYKEFEKGKIYSSLIEIDLEGEILRTVVNQISSHPINNYPIDVEFTDLNGRDFVKISTKINFLNKEKSPGIKKSGFLHVNSRLISLYCSSFNKMPSYVDVDVSKLHIGDKIKASDVTIPGGTKLIDKNVIIASLIGRGSSKDDAEEKEESEST